MSSFVESVLELLPAYGPPLLFVLAILETCFVTGLAVPSGLATSAATVLALEGRVELVPMLIAAVAGGAVGDTIGFWIGRACGARVLAPESRWSRLLGSRRADLDDLFGRHPLFSVTTARLVSFVRTLMPMAAGMSGLPYRRFLPYELVGVVGWGVMYALIGLLARESWVLATRVAGVGGAVACAVVLLVAWRLIRRRPRGEREATV